MPIYEFKCFEENCSSEGKPFEIFCKSYKEVEDKQIECPHCKSKEIEKLISRFNISFKQPEESSKYHNFEYQARHRMDKAKEERRYAERNSHMGPNPHPEIPDLENMGEGIFDKGDDYE